MPTFSRFLRGCATLVLLVVGGPAAGQEFSVLVSPPRFEERALAGETWRGVVELTNVSAADTTLSLRTADWMLLPDGSAEFLDALQPSSCRPWVGIEAPTVRIGGNGKRRYRFEVAVPADAPIGECRFALMVEGDAASSGTAVAVAGRIAVIVYIAIGGATPRLDVLDGAITELDGRRVPALRVRNTGTAHGRLDGLVDGVDAAGRRLAFAPSSLPILPGETRAIALLPQADGPEAPAPVLAWPVRIEGRLESAGGPLRIEAAFAE